MAENQESTKVGTGHAAAMFRQGLSELRAAIYTESNVVQPGQYGLYGTRTPGEVQLSRKAESRDIEEEPHLEAEGPELAPQAEGPDEGKGLDMERE